MKKKPYGKIEKMARAALMLFAVAAIALIAQMSGPTWAPAYTDGSATKLNDLQVDDLKLNGGDIVDTNGTTRLTVGSANAFVGSLTTSGRIINADYSEEYLRTSAQIKVTTPTIVGQRVFDTTLKQPIWSSGTSTCFDWVTSTGTRPSGY